jgi:glycosyltransferase involved in cell wall biosynthesis
MTAHLGNHESPLVVHVIPSALGRGAQRAARILVDRLNEPGVVEHRLLALFDGTPDVDVDMSLGISAGSRPGKGLDPRLALKLRRFLAPLHPAAVVAHGGDAMKYALPAVIGTKSALVYCVIGTYAGRHTQFHEWPWRRIIARADLVVAVGDEVLDECIGRFRAAPRNVIVIPNGRDPIRFRPRSDSSQSAKSTLIYVGALTAQKQPDRFFEIVRRLRSEGRSFRAVVVGDGPLASSLGPVAEAHGVEMLGARSDVAELLRSSDVFVFTSRPTGEGMPGVLIEAGLSGLAVVSTPVPGASTVVCNGRTGLIVEDSVATLSAAVRELLDDPDRRGAMGRSARTRCESEFNLDLMAERWQSALEPMLSVK